jgi:hypothetical protein
MFAARAGLGCRCQRLNGTADAPVGVDIRDYLSLNDNIIEAI